MEIFNHHKALFLAALSLYVLLTLLVTVFPAIGNQNNNSPLPKSKELNSLETDGKLVYIAEGCTGCHTQQVRNLEMDKTWGGRPGVAADYARILRTDFWRNTATLMGSERTGPDLTNVGLRQPSREWNLLHLYNPRIVTPASIMPSYAWLFDVKDYVDSGDVVISVPEEFRTGVIGKVVASRKSLALFAYLASLKQGKMPGETAVPAIKNSGSGTTVRPIFDGAALYAENCQSCHQENGEGLAGAFPALKGSKVVLNEDPEVQLTIIMNGYSGRVTEGYGIMPPVGTNNHLKPEEIAAIINHERSSWGNNSKTVTSEQVRKLMDHLETETVAVKKK
jgi:cytochrome c oxidase cbb3-type subunit 2